MSYLDQVVNALKNLRQRVHLVNPPELPRPRGYSHGAVGRGRLLTVAGQIGWDSAGRLVAPDFVPQFRQALSNVVTVVRAAGGSMSDLVHLRIYVTDKQRYLVAKKELGRVYRELIGGHYPPMALVEVTALLEEGALVEIEAMAMIPAEGPC